MQMPAIKILMLNINQLKKEIITYEQRKTHIADCNM